MKVTFKKDPGCRVTWHVYYEEVSKTTGKVYPWHLCSIHDDSVKDLVEIPRGDYGTVSEFEAELNISVLEAA